MGLKIAALTNHFSGLEALKGIDSSRVPINLIITNKSEDENEISGMADFSELGIEIFELSSYNMKSDIHSLISLELDLLFVLGYQRLVPEEVINSVRLGSFGFHGSSEFLPKGRGRSPINWELISGKDRFISHMFRLEPGADSGEIVDHMIFEVNHFDDCRTVYYKAALSMRNMLERTVPLLIEGSVNGITQTGEATYFPKRSPEDGEIDWSMNTKQVHDWIRALTKPYPGAFTEGLKIWKGQPFSDKFTSKSEIPGQVIEKFLFGEILIKTGDGAYLVSEYEGETPEVGTIFRRH